MDRIGLVDLSRKVVEYPDIFLNEKVGGRALATKIYWKMIGPEIKAFDPENVIILIPGSLVATGVKAANRMVVMGKSPMTYPMDGFCYGNIGGFFPGFFRRAGLDGLILQGRAEKPIYLFISEGKIHIMDATELWGKGALESIRILKEKHGAGVEVLTIGPAGEKLVSFSTLVSSHQSSSTGGFGAVFGSKNLKAIVVKASRKISPADSQGLKKLNEYAKFLGRRLRLSIPPKMVATGRVELLKVIGKGSCYGCDFECIRGKYDYGGGLTGFRKCQAMEYYLPWLYSKEDEPIETLFFAPQKANDFGLCTFELERIIDWLFAAFSQGALSSKEARLPLENIGRMSFLQKLFEVLLQKEGIWEILSLGSSRAKDRLDRGLRDVFEQIMKPISLHLFLPLRDLDDARGHLVNALLYQTEPRIHRPLIHQGFVLVAWQFNQINPEISPITSEIYKKICKVFWGSEASADDSTYEGKALAATKIQNRLYVLESLGLCTFAWPIVYSLNTPDFVGDPELENKFFATINGIELEEAKEILDLSAKQTINLQRLILLREGWPVPESDWPPEYHFIEPLPPHPFGHRPIYPGFQGKPFTAEGRVLDYEGYQRMITEYYKLRGWDSQGRPLSDTLTSLKLEA